MDMAMLYGYLINPALVILMCSLVLRSEIKGHYERKIYELTGIRTEL